MHSRRSLVIEQNLSTLRINAILAKAARAYAERLARSGQFSHTADGGNPGKRALFVGEWGEG